MNLLALCIAWPFISAIIAILVARFIRAGKSKGKQ